MSVPGSSVRRRTASIAKAASIASAVVAVTIAAAVSAQETAELGGTRFTPLGAERAGNSAGTIPAWTGGITEPPPGFRPGSRHPDPFAEDAVRFTIDAGNLAEHSAHLTDGQQALLRARPDSWRMRVFPTRRSASFPDFVYTAVRANAHSARLVVEGKGGVLDATVGPPFPFPESGLEVVWNHNLRFRGIRVQRSEGVAAVTRRGRYRVVLNEEDFGFPYASPTVGPYRRKHPNVMMGVKAKTVAPALLSGRGFMLIEPIDQTRDPRKAWTFNPDLRRVIRQPTFAYDHPARNSEGLRTVDEFNLFNGAPDRFEWKLLGKREIYIPYNAYRLHGADVGPDDIILPHHLNPDLARYELHRVWVVEGRLREGKSHIYSRRVFYVDEDTWQIALSESYDADGNLWRIAEAHALNYYEVPAVWTTLEVFYDLRQERYLVNGLDNQRNEYRFLDGADPREFSPQALLYYVR